MLLLLCVLLILVKADITSEDRLRCGKNQDCKQLDSFCHGAYVCNLTARCAKQDASYDPCKALRKVASVFSRQHSEYRVSILCVEELKACVEVYYCTRDEDCDDTLYCNGIERCIDGQCKAATDQSHSICDDCNEETRCGESSLTLFNSMTFDDLIEVDEDDEEEANPTIIYTVAVIFALVGTIVVFILLVYIFHWASTSQ
jgi:hypothetical protein